MYGLRPQGTIRAAAPDRFINDGNAREPRDARCIGRRDAVRRRGSTPQRRVARASLWRQRAFSMLRGLAPRAGSGKIPRFLESVDACAASGRRARQRGLGRIAR
jgi:hypothetical protein